MDLIVAVGTQLRHKYILSELSKNFNIVAIIHYKRTLVQEPGHFLNVTDSEKATEKEHLSNLAAFEKECFKRHIIEDRSPAIHVKNKRELNSPETINFIKQNKADCFIDYGTGILEKETLAVLPKWKINIHGGISPHYRGSATLLWPLFFRQPWLIGMTLHDLTEKIDGGFIYQHIRPKISLNDKPYEIGTNAVIETAKGIIKLIKKLEKTGQLEGFKQKGSGKLFVEKDYSPFIIKKIYEDINNGLIESYLNNKNIYDEKFKPIDQIGT